MTSYDVTKWGKRNLWPLQSGGLAVRPGLRQLIQIQPSDNLKIVGGFSIKNHHTDESWHYVFMITTNGPKNLTLRVYDDLWTLNQTLAIGVDVDPRAITCAVVLDEILITGPDFPPLWGVVGSMITFAESVESDSGSTAIPIPRGICTSWCNRAVICDGRTMYVSDPVAVTGGTIRTFIPENANQRPGVIYGVHEGAGGRLVVVTSEGTYGIGADAAAVGIVGSNGTEWEMLNHHSAHSYESSCAVRGRIFALTQGGYMLVDTENDAEYPLSEMPMSRAFGPRIFSDDWRIARMFAFDDGPVVSHEEQSAAHMHDLSSKIASWWTSEITSSTYGDFIVRGVLHDADGEPLLLAENGVYMLDGDFDAIPSDGLTPQFNDPKGVVFASLPSTPMQNRDVVAVHAMGTVGGYATTDRIQIALRGKAYGESPPPDSEGIEIDVDDWDEGRATSTPMGAVRIKMGQEAALPTREPTIEVAILGCMNRIGLAVDVEESGSAPLRPAREG